MVKKTAKKSASKSTQTISEKKTTPKTTSHKTTRKHNHIHGPKMKAAVAIVMIAVVIGAIYVFSDKGMSSNICEAVTQHLNEMKKADIASDASVVKAGDQIEVDYIGRLADGTVFDTSVESVAKGCGDIYNAGRNYDEGLPFEVGAGQMIAGFDAGVQGMKVGETKTITIPAADAYGEWSEDNIVEIPLDQVPPKPDGSDYVAGDEIPTAYGPMKIQAVSQTNLSLDTNHELAGKDLIFDITVLSIN